MQRELSGIMFSYMNKSQYHETCIPSHLRQQPVLEPNSKPLTVLDYTKCDEVKENRVWTQCVKNEENAVKRWKEQWGFLTQYDTRGNYVERKPLPEYESRFSGGPVPNTQSGVYGSRSGSQFAQSMLLMENALAAGNRRKKLDREFVCY